MPFDPMDLVARAETHRSVTGSGRGFTITFGSNDVRRDKWDGAYPVEVWRCEKHCDDTLHERLFRVVKQATPKQTPFNRAIREAGSGWAVRAVEQWVELRTPATRNP